jgi:hypothetical protein
MGDGRWKMELLGKLQKLHGFTSSHGSASGVCFDCPLNHLCVKLVSGMSQKGQTLHGEKRHQRFRQFGAYQNFAEADAQLREYWWSRTPQERMEALEALRISIYGQEAIDARIPRVFGVPEPRRR